jgi:dehydrodolichyl diphosphate syntase complex subunit NUS1
MRSFLKKQVYLLLFTIIHSFFSVYLRFRKAYHATVDRIISIIYHHHRSPELIKKDVKNLDKLPQHMSIVLDLNEHEDGAGLEQLVNDVGEVAAWCACVGIPMLSVYERTGICHK